MANNQLNPDSTRIASERAGLAVQPWPLDRLHPHPRNYRRHPDEQLAVLRESLRVHGQQKPVVIMPDGTILAGHGVVEAAKLEGWEGIACHVYDGPYADAFLAIDNRSSDLAEDDQGALATLLRDLEAHEQLGGSGWSEDDLSELVLRLETEEKRGREESFDADQAMAEAQRQGRTRVQPGEVWALGRHRLMCGDATDGDAMAVLMAGDLARLLACDPPYGVDYDGNQHRREHNGGIVYRPIANDDLDPPQLQAFLTAAFSAALPHLAEDAAWYVWHASVTRPAFLAALAAVGVTVHQEIVWVKESFQFSRSDYHWQHEPCLYGWRECHVFLGERNQSTVWQVARRSDHQHPTVKPLELWEWPIRNHLELGQILLDPFVGSGTAIIAAERTGACARAMEIDPAYCDVAVARWEEFTSQTAERTDA
jgi:site-specific DNA-methyltransferase (adenine-specific)